MARRRAVTGRAVLIALPGVASLVGCGGHTGPTLEPVGNLMAPQVLSVEVCVDLTPPEAAAVAAVTVDGVAASGRCTAASVEFGGPVRVEVTAPGWAPVTEVVPFDALASPVAIALVPDDGPLEPVGNLMPPQ